MAKFTENLFQTVRISLDNNEYERCKFIRCIMEYSGSGSVVLKGCEFRDVKWVFTGSAQNTVEFLRGAYHGLGDGGKMLVEEIFEVIKGGEFKKLPE